MMSCQLWIHAASAKLDDALVCLDYRRAKQSDRISCCLLLSIYAVKVFASWCSSIRANEGKGEMITCSEQANSDLFFGALGGLGQFGIITRARIALEQAPTMVRWVSLVYTDFEAFIRDEEHLISLKGTPGTNMGLNYVYGYFFTDFAKYYTSWKSPFIKGEPLEMILDLAAKNGGAYILEVCLNYDDNSASAVDQEMDSILKDLSFNSGYKFTRDLFYQEFLERIPFINKEHVEEGLWDVAAHPWLNMLVPKSRIHDFNKGVFEGILQQHKSTGVIVCYPNTKHRWDTRMSLMFPEEEIFYTVGLLWSCTPEDMQVVLDQNEQVLRICDQNRIELKQYMAHHKTTEDWMKHFGSKWEVIVDMKKKYDPKAILAPGLNMFMSPLVIDN